MTTGDSACGRSNVRSPYHPAYPRQRAHVLFTSSRCAAPRHHQCGEYTCADVAMPRARSRQQLLFSGARDHPALADEQPSDFTAHECRTFFFATRALRISDVFGIIHTRNSLGLSEHTMFSTACCLWKVEHRSLLGRCGRCSRCSCGCLVD